jgi:Tfp pilus assembly protein PilV
MIEVMIAVVILAVGVLGLASTSALVTRMIGQGHRHTTASAMATEQFEMLQGRVCAGMADSTVRRERFLVGWTVDSIAAGEGRRINLTVQTPTPSGHRVDHFSTSVSCRI